MEPKPCPRCGSTPSVVKRVIGWEVSCDHCEDADWTPAHGHKRLGVWATGDTAQEAIEEWNLTVDEGPE